MLFEEKVVNFLRPLCGTSGKVECNKWFRKLHKSIVPLEVECTLVSESNVSTEPMEDKPHTRKGGIKVFIRTDDGLKVQKNSQDYQGMVKLVEKSGIFNTFIFTFQQKCRNLRDFFVDYVRVWNQGRRDFGRSSFTRLLPKGRKNLIQLAFAPGA